MAKTFLSLLLILTSTDICSLEKLNESYLVSYGDPNSSIKVTQYYSFTCPHCVGLFQQEFEELKFKYLDTKKISFLFHPIPMDLTTVCAMDCLGRLNEKEKRAFLEVMLDEIDIEQPEINIALMKKAMELFEKPIPQLGDEEYMQETKTFKDSFQFLSQDEKVVAIPTLEINGTFYPTDAPRLEFLETILPKYSVREEAHVP